MFSSRWTIIGRGTVGEGKDRRFAFRGGGAQSGVVSERVPSYGGFCKGVQRGGGIK